MSWVAVGAAIAAALLGAYNTQRVAKKADQTAAQGIQAQAKTQREANQRLNRTLEFAEKSTPDDERATAQEQYMAQLQRQMGQAKTGLGPKGVSSAFDAAAAEAGGKVGDYGGVLANLFARMDSPILQRQHEGNAYGDLGMDLSRLTGNVQGDDFLTRLRMQGIRRNPWIDLASSALSGYASGGGGGGGGGGGAAPAWVGTGYGSTWGTGGGLRAAGS